ncbi:MAG: HAMP domain-containing protein [Desulfuromonadaceae bacterium]|nr:HAMP domain-containing protein [Desulfuromonadaceae bacterium]
MNFRLLKKRLATRVGLNSIHGRLTAIAFFFIIGTAVIIGGVGFRYTAGFEKERFHEHFRLLARYMASNAELGMLLGNRSLLAELSDNMLDIEDIESIEIINQQGEIIVTRGHKEAEKRGSVVAKVYSRPMNAAENPFVDVAAEREELGQVRLGYSLRGLARLKNKLALSFLVISSVLALMSAILYLRFSRSIRAPLKDILRVARKVSAGDLNVRAEGGTLLEISTLASAFNEMLVALQLHRRKIQEANDLVAKQKTMAEVGRFSMIVAHEIKNPLAIIKGSLGPLRKTTSTMEVKERMFSFIDDEIDRINRLIEDFLQFSRPRKVVLQRQTVAAFLPLLINRIELLSQQVKVMVPCREECLSRELAVDAVLIGQALLNIVRNGLDAAGPAGEVRVTIDCSDEELLFSIVDNGPGIEEQDLSQIFDPFFSKKAKGTGLGLAIANETVVAHSGHLAAHNMRGGGACFVLSLPFVKKGVVDGADTDC